MEGSKKTGGQKKGGFTSFVSKSGNRVRRGERKLTYRLVQGRHGVSSTFSIVPVLWLIKVAALVIHAAALELAEEVEEAVFIGGVAAQFLVNKNRDTELLSLRRGAN